MKKINTIYFMTRLVLGIVILCTVYSCDNDDDIIISDKTETRFDIPQGDHDFEKQIVEWSKNYDINVLYKFSLPDLNYQFMANKNLQYEVAAWAEEDGIRSAVKFLQEDFINLYSDETKKTLFPSKILLAGMLYKTKVYEPLLDTLALSTTCPLGVVIRGMDHLTLPRVDEEFTQRISSQTYRKKLKLAINRTFINFLLFPPDENLEQLPSSEIVNTFCSYTLVHESHPEITDPYSYENKWYTLEDTYKLGFLAYGSYSSYNGKYSPLTYKEEDLTYFINFIFSQTKNELHANPLYTNYPQIKKKCDYLIEAFAEYGIDLYCVGGKE